MLEDYERYISKHQSFMEEMDIKIWTLETEFCVVNCLQDLNIKNLLEKL